MLKLKIFKNKHKKYYLNYKIKIDSKYYIKYNLYYIYKNNFKYETN